MTTTTDMTGLRKTAILLVQMGKEASSKILAQMRENEIEELTAEIARLGQIETELADDVLFLTFNGLSKNYRSCGYRAGWMVVSGDKKAAADYIEGLNMLSNMRLCANVPGQWAIQTALGGYQSINELVGEGGRLRRQRDLAYELITAIPGVTCVKPTAALYMFPRLDPKVYPIADDRQFFLELLQQTRVMLVQGTGFNWATPDHFRIVFLPHEGDLREAVSRIARFLENYRKRKTQ